MNSNNIIEKHDLVGGLNSYDTCSVQFHLKKICQSQLLINHRFISFQIYQVQIFSFLETAKFQNFRFSIHGSSFCGSSRWWGLFGELFNTRRRIRNHIKHLWFWIFGKTLSSFLPLTSIEKKLHKASKVHSNDHFGFVEVSWTCNLRNWFIGS